ncbi:MAG: hypothetical protein DWQ04_34210 [Chloroflexi bacterium]|nr:MAG: hypothetical protein DWQ04_34210 [Chloroflexota bacterium]
MTPQPINIQPMLSFVTPWESANLVTIRIDYDDYALSCDDANNFIDELFEYYLSLDNFSFQFFQVGMEIWSGQKSWTDYTCDQFCSFSDWIHLLVLLKEKDENFKTVWFMGEQAFYGAIERQNRLLLLREVPPSTETNIFCRVKCLRMVSV